MWRRRRWRHLVVTCQTLTEKLLRSRTMERNPTDFESDVVSGQGLPIQHAWCLQSQTDSSFLFFTRWLSSWKPACRLRPRSTGPVNHREINGFQKTACVTANTAAFVKLSCCPLPYQMQLVVFHPVSPAAVLLLSDLLTHQFVSLPCHQWL